MYIISATSVLYSSPLYMICMSLGNKDYFIVIIIAIVISYIDIMQLLSSTVSYQALRETTSK